VVIDDLTEPIAAAPPAFDVAGRFSISFLIILTALCIWLRSFFYGELLLITSYCYFVIEELISLFWLRAKRETKVVTTAEGVPLALLLLALSYAEVVVFLAAASIVTTGGFSLALSAGLFLKGSFISVSSSKPIIIG